MLLIPLMPLAILPGRVVGGSSGDDVWMWEDGIFLEWETGIYMQTE